MKKKRMFAAAAALFVLLLLSAVPLVIFVVSLLQGLHIPVDLVERTASLLLNKEATKVVTDFMTNVYDGTVSISLISMIASARWDNGTIWFMSASNVVTIVASSESSRGFNALIRSLVCRLPWMSA